MADSATAESCPGGLVSEMLTTLPGISDFILGGVVSYSNEAKIKFLGVDPSLIESHGAVSPEVVWSISASRPTVAFKPAVSISVPINPGTSFRDAPPSMP